MVRYRSWSALFAVASIGLASVLWLQTAPRPEQEAATSPKSATNAPPGRQNSPTARLGKRNAYNAIAERPLFARTRTPPEDAPADEEPKARTNLPNLILKGTVISADEKYILLQKLPSTETIRMNEGQSVEGWRIETILPDRVIFTSGEKTEEIELWSEQSSAPKQPTQALPRRPKIKLPSPQNRK